MNDSAVMPRGNAVAAEVRGIMSNSATPNDGRNRRAAETRRKVIEAAKAMIAETSIAPTVVGVARRADVSVRSVFQHFRDVESLFVTVCDNVHKDMAMPPETPGTLPQSERIDSFARNIAQVYEQIVPLRVAAGQFVGHPALLARGEAVQRFLRDTALRTFAQEFSLLSEQEREGLADAMGAAMSLEAWMALRRLHKLSLERALAAWRLTLEALLAHPVMQVAAD
jgi:AcrR family transcriptional regulator